MRRRLQQVAIIAIYAAGCEAGACNLSVQDQVLLIELAEARPSAGMANITKLAGMEVECAAVGPFRVVRRQNAGMYVLDPRCAFNRWGETGQPFPADSTVALRRYFASYKLTMVDVLRNIFGRKPFGEPELEAMSIRSPPSWEKRNILAADEYARVRSERLSERNESALVELVLKRARDYARSNEGDDVSIIDMRPDQIRKYSSEVKVAVAIRRAASGRVERTSLLVPVNALMPPYVGRARKQETDVNAAPRPFGGGGGVPGRQLR